jgi:hypothetical protein
MNSAEVFYNREDLWQFPRQPTGGDEATMAPYYIIVRLPGEPQAEFLQMLPMVPSQRQNMIAWLAARSDPPDYGKLIVYEFPKDKLVYGPFQIEARIGIGRIERRIDRVVDWPCNPDDGGQCLVGRRYCGPAGEVAARDHAGGERCRRKIVGGIAGHRLDHQSRIIERDTGRPGGMVGNYAP